MTRNLTFALLAAASLASGGAAIAATKPMAQAHTTVATRTAVTKQAGKPVAAKRTTVATRTATATAANGRMVTTKTTTGKTVTYNCGKAGNANKSACKS